MDGTLVSAYREASLFFVDVTSRVDAAQWNELGIGEWTIRELVGHGNRSHTLVEDNLRNPQPTQPLGSPYFSEEAIAQRGREAAEALGTDPLAAVTLASKRAIELIETEPADATIGSALGTMTLAEYLPTRIAELVIHGLDLEDALGIAIEVPALALETSLVFVARRCAKKEGARVLRSLTGRADLPAKFSIY